MQKKDSQPSTPISIPIQKSTSLINSVTDSFYTFFSKGNKSTSFSLGSPKFSPPPSSPTKKQISQYSPDRRNALATSHKLNKFDQEDTKETVEVILIESIETGPNSDSPKLK